MTCPRPLDRAIPEPDYEQEEEYTLDDGQD